MMLLPQKIIKREGEDPKNPRRKNNTKGKR
jgi:hypothetical protein